MEASAQYQSWATVQDRLVAVMRKIGSFDEGAYDAAAVAVGVQLQQPALDDLAALFQSSMKIRDYYFQETTGGVVPEISRGVSMLGRYWGLADHAAAEAVGGLSQAVSAHEQAELAVESYTGQTGSVGTFVSQPVRDPMEVGKQEQKDDVRAALTSYLPWVLGGLVLLFVLRKYL